MSSKKSQPQRLQSKKSFLEKFQGKKSTVTKEGIMHLFQEKINLQHARNKPMQNSGLIKQNKYLGEKQIIDIKQVLAQKSNGLKQRAASKSQLGQNKQIKLKIKKQQGKNSSHTSRTQAPSKRHNIKKQLQDDIMSLKLPKVKGSISESVPLSKRSSNPELYQKSSKGSVAGHDKDVKSAIMIKLRNSSQKKQKEQKSENSFGLDKYALMHLQFLNKFQSRLNLIQNRSKTSLEVSHT